jgi:peptide/nickel transport system permease protein
VRFLARRGIFYLVTPWAAATINFLIPRLMPGNPVEAQLAHHQGQMTPQATFPSEINTELIVLHLVPVKH